MKVSEHVRERTQKKAMMVMVFLKLMHTRDVDKQNLEVGGKHAYKIAAKVRELLGTNKTAVYNAYKEWKEGERLEGDDDGPPRPGEFYHRTQGYYERRVLLHEEDLKMKFKKWMRTNLR